MKRALLILFTLTSTNIFSQDIESVIGEIYSDTTILRDPINKEIPDKYYVNRMMEIETLIRSRGFKIFPSNVTKGKILELNQDYDSGPGTTDFDKIVTWVYNVNGDLNPLLDTTKGIYVDSTTIHEVVNIVENPLNFNWGECGTFIPRYAILFQDKDNHLKYSVAIGCGYIQIDLYPPDPRVKTGGLEKLTTQELQGWIEKNKK